MVAGAAGDLADVGGRLAERVGDFRVLQIEDVAKDQRSALDRVQPLQGAEQCEAQPLGLDRLGLRRFGVGDQRLRQPGADVDLAPGASRTQAVEREPGRHRDQEGFGVAHSIAICPVPAQPCILDDVLGLGELPQDSVGDAQQARSTGGKGVACHAGTGTRLRSAAAAAAAPLDIAASTSQPSGPSQSPAR